jgi:serine/threonine protein kinase
MVNLRSWFAGLAVTSSQKASYQFYEELGKGGFGQVTRARNKYSSGEVAIKKVPKSFIRGQYDVRYRAGRLRR